MEPIYTGIEIDTEWNKIEFDLKYLQLKITLSYPMITIKAYRDFLRQKYVLQDTRNICIYIPKEDCVLFCELYVCCHAMYDNTVSYSSMNGNLEIFSIWPRRQGKLFYLLCFIHAVLLKRSFSKSQRGMI